MMTLLSSDLRREKDDSSADQIASPHLPWFLRVAMPSITDTIFVILLLAMTCGPLAQRLLGDGDTGWHIRNGELILQTHRITRVDPFSSTMQGQPWYSWEWLYDVAAGSLHQWAGLNAVVFASAVIIAFVFALMFSVTLRRGGNIAVTFVLFAFTLAATAIHLFARPHIVSWLFIILWFYLLDSSELPNPARKSSRLFWMPLIMLFWINLHGEFLFGFVLLGIYLASAVARWMFLQYRLTNARENNDTETSKIKSDLLAWLKRLTFVSMACAVVTFINPNGYKLHLHIYGYLSNHWLMDHIQEFQSPNFHHWSEQAFAILLLITVVAFAVARRRPTLSQVLVILFAVHGGFYASRNLPTSCMLLTLIVAPLLSTSIISEDDKNRPRSNGFLARPAVFVRRMGILESNLRWHLWPVIAVLFGIFVCAHSGRLGSTQVMNAHFDPAHFPVESAAYISSHNVDGPIFAPDAWGGYLIYRLYPYDKVVIDDRHDLYGEAFLKDYIKVVSVSVEWETVLDRERVSWVLAPNGSSLANILEQSSQWGTIHKDDCAELFQRR